MTPPRWSPEQVRAWVERHGTATDCAARLRVPRSQLQAWMADPTKGWAREIPPYIQAHMEAIDTIEEGRNPARAARARRRDP
jgi:hypothetical protein